MDLNLHGKTAFITGSTAGIGLATAKALASEGCHLILHGRSRESVERVVNTFYADFPDITVDGIAFDALTQDSIHPILHRPDNIDILINNVGIYRSGSFYETTDRDWFDQFEVNVMTGVRLSRTILPAMMKKNWGRIIFVSSECAHLVPPALIAYSSTKAAILALSRGLAQLTKGSNVTVNAIVPGSTMTEGAHDLLQDLAMKSNRSVTEVENDFIQRERGQSLIMRFARPTEVAATITYLCSPLSSATNGSVIKTDGGSVGGIF